MNEDDDDDDDDNTAHTFSRHFLQSATVKMSQMSSFRACTIPNLVNAYQMSENEGFEPIVIAQKKYEPDYGWKGV